MRKIKVLRIAGFLVVLGLIFLWRFTVLERWGLMEHKKLTVRLAIPLQPSSALALIAHKKGYFSKEGLKVIVKNYPSGKRALHEGLIAQEVDVAFTADVPFVLESFRSGTYQLVATTGVSDSIQRIIARKDSGITTPSDLKGKRAATQRGSAVHYFLYLFLLHTGMNSDDIILSFKKAEELPLALAEAHIDAFSMREPYIEQAKNLLGEEAVIFKRPGTYLSYECFIASGQYIDAHPEVIRRIVRALILAEDFSREHASASQEIVSEALGVSSASLDAFWAAFAPVVSLGQDVFVGFEDIARWAIAEEIVAADSVPNYLEFIHCQALEEIKPEAVTFIH